MAISQFLHIILKLAQGGSFKDNFHQMQLSLRFSCRDVVAVPFRSYLRKILRECSKIRHYLKNLLRNMARTSRWQLVGIDKKSTVRIARVQGKHTVVNVLLSTLGLVTRGQKSASRVGGQASFQTSGLSVVVVTIRVVLRNVLQNHAPVPFNIDGPLDLAVHDLGGAQVALGADPVASVIRRGSLGSSSVVLVVKSGFLVSGDVFNQIIGALVGHVAVLLEEDGVLRDLVSDIVVGVFRVFEAVGEVGVNGTGWGSLGVTVSVDGGGIGSGVVGVMVDRVVGSGMVRGRMVGSVVRDGGGSEGYGHGYHHGGDLK